MDVHVKDIKQSSKGQHFGSAFHFNSAAGANPSFSTKFQSSHSLRDHHRAQKKKAHDDRHISFYGTLRDKGSLARACVSFSLVRACWDLSRPCFPLRPLVWGFLPDTITTTQQTPKGNYSIPRGLVAPLCAHRCTWVCWWQWMKSGHTQEIEHDKWAGAPWWEQKWALF